MLVRAFEFARFFTLLLALSLLLPTSQVLAAGDKVWVFSEGNDVNNRGRMTARLAYRVPQTDNVQVDGVCEARSGTSISTASLILGADTGSLKEGSSVKVRFSGGGFERTINGLVFGTELEVGVSGVSLDIDVKDPLWNALTTKVTLDYQLPGYSSSRLKLIKGHAKIRQFIRACRDYADALGTSAQVKPEPVTTADAKPKPKKPAPIQAASSETSQKEAFNSAKELGTLEAWEAFLTNFPTGFRAELASAYLKRLGGSVPQTPAASAPVTQTLPPVVETAIAPPPPAATPADISISTTANQTSCKGGDSCSYTVVATNNGGEAFVGELVIANSLAPRGATLTSPGNAPWFCQGMGGGAVCSNPAANIAPGASTNLSLTFQLPRRAGGSVTSCASISWGGVPTASTVRDVQQALNDQGQNVGRPDGQAGRKTKAAIRAYQKLNGLQETGEVDLPLLIAMFTVPGAGDGDPINDQSCTGSSVIPAQTSFIPQPQVSYCGGGRVLDPAGRCACPATYPHWTGKSCLPRRVRNCRGGTYYSKRQKLCLCPSRKPFWHGNRCHTKPLPIPPAGSDGHLLNKQQAGCPSTHIRIGNVCVNLGIVPVFGNRGGSGRGGRGSGGGTAILPGGGAGGQQAGTGGGKKSKGGKRGGPKTQTTGAKTCGIGVKVTPGSCACPTGSVFSNKSNSCFVPAKAKQRPKCPLNTVFNNVNNCESQASVVCRGGAGVPGGGTICHVNGSAAQKAWLKKQSGQKRTGTQTKGTSGTQGTPATTIICAAPAKKKGNQCVCPPGRKLMKIRVGGTSVPGGPPIPQIFQYSCHRPLPICNPSIISGSGTCNCADGYAQQKAASGGIRCVLGGKGAKPKKKGAKDPFDCGDGRRTDNVSGRCLCPSGLSFIIDSCVQTTQGKSKNGQITCPPGMTIRPGSRDKGGPGICVPAAKAQQIRQIIQQRQQQQANQCVNNEIRFANGKCGCPSNLPRHLQRQCYAAAPVQQQQQQQSGCPPTHNKIGTRCVLKPPKPQGAKCPSNMIRLSNNKCGCPDWAHLKNGQCVRKPAPTLKQVKCTANQIFNGQRCVTCGPNQVKQGNTCVNKAQQQINCPPTHNKVGNRCVAKPKPQQVKCPNNQAKLPNGQCGCGNWADLKNGFCVRKPAPTLKEVKSCPPTQFWNGKQCQWKPQGPTPAQKAAQQKAAQQAAQQKAQQAAQQKAAQQAAQQKAAQQAAQQKAAQQAAQQKAAQQAAQQKAAQQKAAQQAAQAKAAAAAKAKAEAAAAAANTLKLRQQLQQQKQQGPCPAGQIVGQDGKCTPHTISDIRLKRDIAHVETLGNGLKLYSFRYLWSDESHVGVMAQDLLLDPAHRDAVVLQTSGYYAVDYAMLGLKMVTLDEWKYQGEGSVLLNTPDHTTGVSSPVVQGNR